MCDRFLQCKMQWIMILRSTFGIDWPSIMCVCVLNGGFVCICVYIYNWSANHFSSITHCFRLINNTNKLYSLCEFLSPVVLKVFSFVCVCVCVHVCVCFFHTSKKSWRGYIFIADCLSLCVCVCVCVCVCQWTKFQPNGCTNLDAVFSKLLRIALSQTLLKLLTLGQRSRSHRHGGVISIFLHNSLLISLRWISALLCPIKLKLCLLLRYVLGRFIMTPFKFSPNNCPDLKFY